MRFIKIKDFTSILKNSQPFKKCILFLTCRNNEYIVNHKENKWIWNKLYRRFLMVANGVISELCSWGASGSSHMVPPPEEDRNTDHEPHL